MFLGLGLAVILARGLGPRGSGLYTLAILIGTILVTILNLGVSAANVYFVGSGQVPMMTALRASLIFGVACSVVGLAFGCGLLLIVSPAPFVGLSRTNLLVALLCFPVALFQQLLASLLQAKNDFRSFNRGLLAAPALTLILVALFAQIYNLSVTIALASYLLGLLAGSFYTWHSVASLTRRAMQLQELSVRSYAGRALKYGWKAQISNALTMLVYRVDILLVGIYLTPRDVGIYAIATQLAERLWVPSQAVSTVLLPRLAQLNHDEDVRRVLAPLVARWTLAVTAIGALLLALIARPLITLAFGSNFSSVRAPLLLMLPGVVFLGAARVHANALAARGKPELTLYASLVVVGVNVGANLALIPIFGVPGAAVATTIAYCLDALLLASMSSRLSGAATVHGLIIQRGDLRRLATELRRTRRVWRLRRRDAS